MQPIDILTGPIHSGKTTHLISWIKYHSHCAGILSPRVDKKRQFYSIHNQIFHPFETEGESEENIIRIGKYQFLRSGFEWARRELAQALESNPQWLIIDEIGLLELEGGGLEPEITRIIDYYLKAAKNRLILVIREQLLEQAIKHYNLDERTNIHELFLEIV